MEMEYGEKIKMRQDLINTLDPTSLIRSMDMVSSLGSQAMSTKEATFRMKEKAMGRCILMMALYTRETGNEVSKLEAQWWFYQMEL